jgi:predicted DNA-binding protein (MmcQ/YjbR family)
MRRGAAGVVNAPNRLARSGHAVRVDVDAMLAHCLAKPGAWPDNPWEHDHPVVKVGPGERGKIFAFLARAGVGVKSGRSREEADAWLERYPGSASVMRYIGRSGWNDLAFDGIPDDELMDAVDTSYRIVVEGLPKKLRPEGWDAAG